MSARPLLFIAALAMSALAFDAAAEIEIPEPLSQDEIDSRYRAEREACAGLRGKAKNACKQTAKNHRHQAQAEAKRAKHEAQIRREAERQKRRAQYRLDRAHCDALTGEAKEKCIADAKKHAGF